MEWRPVEVMVRDEECFEVAYWQGTWKYEGRSVDNSYHTMTFGDAIQERYLCTKCRRNLVASNQFDTKPEANIVLVGYRLSFQHIFRICLALLSGTAIQFWMDSCMQATPPIFPPHLDAMRLPYLRVFGIFISRVFLLCMSDASPPFELPFAVFRLVSLW